MWCPLDRENIEGVFLRLRAFSCPRRTIVRRLCSRGPAHSAETHLVTREKLTANFHTAIPFQISGTKIDFSARETHRNPYSDNASVFSPQSTSSLSLYVSSKRASLCDIMNRGVKTSGEIFLACHQRLKSFPIRVLLRANICGQCVYNMCIYVRIGISCVTYRFDI